MRVVIASRIYAPEPAAASFRLKALSQAVQAIGGTVTVLTSTLPRNIDVRDRTHGAEDVRRMPVLRDGSGYIRGYAQYLSFDLGLFFRLLFVRRPNIVVVEPPPTSGLMVRIVCAVRRIPFAYYAADVWSDAAANTAPPWIVRLLRTVERGVLNSAAVVLSVSPTTTDRLRELGVLSTIREVGNGVETKLFEHAGPRQLLDAPYFLYAGTASEVHGAGIFVEAFACLLEGGTSARLVFVGHGADYPALQKRSSELPPGSVIFHPRQSPEDVASWIRGAVSTLASVKPDSGYDFAFPTKAFASVSAGTPVIFTGVGPGAEFASNPLVGEVAAYDPSAVAEAMRRAIKSGDDNARRSLLAEWAQENVSLESVARRAVRAISQVVDGTTNVIPISDS